jgi:hypothetical protein
MVPTSPDLRGSRVPATEKKAVTTPLQQALSKMARYKVKIPTSPVHRTSLAQEVTEITSEFVQALDEEDTKVIRLHAQVQIFPPLVKSEYRYCMSTSIQAQKI